MATQDETQSAQPASTGQSLTIDGKTYPVDKLSSDARQQLANIQMADIELTRLQRQLALIQTARNVYVQVLKAEVAQTKTIED